MTSQSSDPVQQLQTVKCCAAKKDHGRTHPRILIVARRYLRKNKWVNIVGEPHLDLLQKNGAAPIIVPRTLETLESLQEYLPADGVLLVEGEDIGMAQNPYGSEGVDEAMSLSAEIMKSHPSDTSIDSPKDEVESALIEICLALGVPFLGICRGSQLMNVKMGGSIFYDIGQQLPNCPPHISYDNSDGFRHSITVVKDTPLHAWLHEDLPSLHDASAPAALVSTEQLPIYSGSSLIDRLPSPLIAGDLSVNSYHHQGVRRLASGLAPMALSLPEGLIEGFYRSGQHHSEAQRQQDGVDNNSQQDGGYAPALGRFLVGLQFHPERMPDAYRGICRVYADFVAAARVWADKRRQIGLAVTWERQAACLEAILDRRVAELALDTPTDVMDGLDLSGGGHKGVVQVQV